MTSALLVRLSAMGDLVQSLGAVAALRAARPDWRLTFVTQREWAPLLRDLPGLARVVCFDRRGGLPALRAVRRELRTEPYDFALDLQGNWKSAFVAWLSGARRRVGMRAAWRQEPASRVLLHRAVGCDAVPHPARAAWELAKVIAPEAPYCAPQLVAAAAEIEAERGALREVGIDPDRPFRVVVGTSPADARALRPARVQRLLDAPQAVLVTGPAEAAFELSSGHPRLRHGAGEVRRLVALGAAVAAAGGDVGGPDQGATHVLLAAGARGTVLFGSQDPARTAPPGARALVAPRELDCRPCRRPPCRLPPPRTYACMEFDPEDGAEVVLGLPRRDERERG